MRMRYGIDSKSAICTTMSYILLPQRSWRWRPKPAMLQTTELPDSRHLRRLLADERRGKSVAPREPDGTNIHRGEL
jgi:hypothetical protein